MGVAGGGPVALKTAMPFAPPSAAAVWSWWSVAVTSTFGIPWSGSCGFGRTGILCELAEVDSNRSKEEFIGSVAQPAQPGDSEGALQLREAHLDFLAVIPRLLIGGCTLKCPRHVTGIFVNWSTDCTLLAARTALWFQRASAAVCRCREIVTGVSGEDLDEPALVYDFNPETFVRQQAPYWASEVALFLSFRFRTRANEIGIQRIRRSSRIWAPVFQQSL